MLRRLPHLLLGYCLLGSCLLGAVAGTAEARGSGIDFWLLDEKGNEIRKLAGSNGDLIDLSGERVYRSWYGKLTAFSFRAGKPLWQVACDIPQRPTQRAFLSGDVLVLLTAEVLVGVNVKDGSERYRVDASGLDLVGPLNQKWRYLEDGGDSLYLVKQKQHHVRASDGSWLRSEAITPPKLLCFDLRTGKQRWRSILAFRESKETVHTVAPGIAIGWNGYVACFGPKTGRKRGRPVVRVSSHLVTKDVVYLLTHEERPRLIAFDGAAGTARWSLSWPVGACRLLACEGGRVWIQGPEHLFAVDEKGPGVTLRIPISPSDDAVPGVRVVGAGRHALLEASYKPSGKDAPRAARRVRAVDPSTARTPWTADPASVGSASDAHIVLVTPRRSVDFHPWADEDPDTPSVYAVAPDTGALLWRWRVPGPPGGYCDDARIAVHRCPTGYLVTRDWSVLD